MNNAADDNLFPERFVPEEMHGLIEAEHLARYQWASAYVKGRRVLDAGCGVGYGSLILRSAGATKVTGVDIAQEAVDAARTRAGGDVEFIAGDIAALPLEDATYDVAVCFEAIEHVQDQARALDELRRILTPSGLLFISSPNREVYLEGNPHHTREYTPDELRSALEERFANVRLERQQAWLISMICDDETLGKADLERPLDGDVRKIAAIPPGRETFTLAVASDEELPSTGTLTMITDLDELSSWQERARSDEEHLARSESSAREAAGSYKSAQEAYESAQQDYKSAQQNYENALTALERSQSESTRNAEQLNRASTLLAERNAALRLVAEELAASRAQTTELETSLRSSNASLAALTGSKSWRLTAPLRALARVRRRG